MGWSGPWWEIPGPRSEKERTAEIERSIEREIGPVGSLSAGRQQSMVRDSFSEEDEEIPGVPVTQSRASEWFRRRSPPRS